MRIVPRRPDIPFPFPTISGTGTVNVSVGDPDFNPQYYDFNLLVPRAPGSAGIGGSTGLESSNRIYKAHQGTPYRFAIAWHGGSWPLVSGELSGDVKSGMEIRTFTMKSGKTGLEFYWPDPQADVNDVTLTLTDKLGNEATATWDIDVTTSNIFFVDSVNGSDGNAGTKASPWQTLAHARTNMATGAILYMRTGTYTLSATDGSGTGDMVMRWSGNTTSHILIGYYGETVVIDGQRPDLTTNVAGFYFDNTGSMWMENVTLENFKNHVVYIGTAGDYGSVLSGITFDNCGPGEDGKNPAMMSITQQTRHGHVMIDCEMVNQVECDGGSETNSWIKFYGAKNSSVIGNHAHAIGFCVEAGFAIKNASSTIMLAGNRVEDCECMWLGGNWNNNGDGGEEGCSISAVFNYVRDGIDLNDAYTGFTNGIIRVARFDSGANRLETHFARNTFIGQALIEGLASGDADFIDHRNAWVNQDTAASPVTMLFDVSWTDSSKWLRTDAYTASAATAATRINSDGEWIGDAVGTHDPTSNSPKGWDE